GHFVASDTDIVIGFDEADETALHLKPKLVIDIGTQIVHRFAHGIGNIDIARDREFLARRRLPGGLGGARITVGDLANRTGRLELRPQHGVAARAGNLDHRLGVGCGRHRHMRRMERLGQRDNALAAPMLAVPVEWLLRGPALENKLKRLAQALVPVLVREPALVGEERTRKARAEAENETPAANDMIGDRRLYGGVDRVSEMDELDRGTHADALGHGRRLAHQQFGYGQRIDLADIDRLAVVLADIDVAKAELVGEYDLGEVFFVSLGGGGVWSKSVRE